MHDGNYWQRFTYYKVTGTKSVKMVAKAGAKNDNEKEPYF